MGKNNIRCNAIAPGGIFNNQDKDFVNKLKKIIPVGRMAKRNEYNDLILFLCSKSSSYITGTVIVCDGENSNMKDYLSVFYNNQKTINKLSS